jgi:uncharacterized protein
MRALLDVNVLIALLDADHTLYGRATQWFAAHAPAGWATCPITQNGCIRIMSHPGYPNALPVRAVAQRLGEAIASAHHAFWPDDISLLGEGVVDTSRIHGPRQITDVYLLALAVRRGGRFVTFDEAAPFDAVVGVTKAHVVTL